MRRAARAPRRPAEGTTEGSSEEQLLTTKDEEEPGTSAAKGRGREAGGGRADGGAACSWTPYVLLTRCNSWIRVDTSRTAGCRSACGLASPMAMAIGSPRGPPSLPLKTAASPSCIIFWIITYIQWQVRDSGRPRASIAPSVWIAAGRVASSRIRQSGTVRATYSGIAFRRYVQPSRCPAATV